MRNKRDVKKYMLVVLLALLVVLSAVPQAQAVWSPHEGGKKETNLNYSGYYVVDDKYQGKTPFERMIAGLFTALSQSIYEILGIKDPLVLIFDYEPAFKIAGEHHPRSELYLGVFTEGERDIIMAFYDTFEAYIPIWMVLVIVLIGLLMVFAGFGGNPVLTAKQYLSGLVVAILLLMFGPDLMKAVFDVSYTIVDIIKDLIERKAAAAGIEEIPKSLLGLMASGFMKGGGRAEGLLEVIGKVTGLGYAVIIFLIFINAGILNFQYIIRKITLGVLIFMFPVVAGMAVFPNTRGALKIWLSEFFSNVFLVSAHAVVYGFLVMLSMAGSDGFRLIEILVFTVGLNGIVNLVRAMFGAPQAGRGILGGLGTIVGLSSLYSVGKTALGLVGKDSPGIVSGLKELAGAGKNDITPTSVAAAGARDTEKIAGMGADLTPSQAGLLRAQLSGNMDPVQEAELAGPQKKLSLDVEEEKSLTFKRKLARLGGAVAVGSVGALASGLLSGRATFGMGVMHKGIHAVDWVADTAKNIRKPGPSVGLYDSGQLFDAKSAVQIGRNIAGRPGTAAGWVAGKVYSGYHRVKGGSEAVQTVRDRAERIREEIDARYIRTREEYKKAERKMQLAQHDLQQVDLRFPAESRINNPEYKLVKRDAEIRLEEAKREFNVKRLELKEAEMMKKNEHDYVGLQLKMENLRRKMRTGGSIGNERGSI